MKLAVVTNSTYDGLCYNAELIKQTLGDSVEVLHFDEAWYAYAAFHEFYDGRYGMGTSRSEEGPWCSPPTPRTRCSPPSARPR